jgi:hypothetical protein
MARWLVTLNKRSFFFLISTGRRHLRISPLEENEVVKVFVAALITVIVVAGLVGYLVFQSIILKNSEEPSPLPSTTPTPSSSATPSPTPTLTPTPTQAPLPTLTPEPTPLPTPAPTPTPTPTPAPTPTPTTNATESDNWAGYVVASSLQNPKPVVTSVNASWVVPAVARSATNTYSAIWIGIGGEFSNDSTLIQVGTEQDSTGGQLQYYVWYELLPASSSTISNIIISPGDQIQASIQLVNATFNQWTINITDTTAAESFQKTVNYTSSQLSAEWIVERPSVNHFLSELANFGNVNFTNCSASVGSVTGGISSFAWDEFVMYSPATPRSSSVLLADVSNLTPGGSGFTVTYQESG